MNNYIKNIVETFDFGGVKNNRNNNLNVKNWHIKMVSLEIGDKIKNNERPDENVWDMYKDMPLYPVYSWDELVALIKNTIRFFGDDCSLNWIDTSNIDDMSHLFSTKNFLHTFNGDISKWNTSNVKNMAAMFASSRFNGDISNWNVSNVENMNTMFESSYFNGDISKWDVSNVKHMNSMFYSSRAFDGDLSKWDVSNVIDMNYMFTGSSFTGDISKWNIINVQDPEKPFRNSRILLKYRPKAPSAPGVISDEEIQESFDFSNVTGQKDVSSIIIAQKKRFLKTIESLIDGTCDKIDSDLQYFFTNDAIYTVKSLEELFNIIKTYMKVAGKKCDLNWIDVSQLDSLKNIFMRSLFDGDISRWDVSNVKDMSNLFSESKFSGDLSNWDVSNVENMEDMFSYTFYNEDISNWDVSNVKNMNSMFKQSVFNGDISKWDVSSVETMNRMFATSIFNKDISRWNVSNVKDMSNMFMDAIFNRDISKWNVSNVENMTGMFFNSIFKHDISMWDVSNVKRNHLMFYRSGHVMQMPEEYKPKFNEDIIEDE